MQNIFCENMSLKISLILCFFGFQKGTILMKKFKDFNQHIDDMSSQ